MGMSASEEKKVKILREKVKKYPDLSREDWMMIGVFAFCEEADDYGGTEHILDEMIKLVDKCSDFDTFIAEAGALVDA